MQVDSGVRFELRLISELRGCASYGALVRTRDREWQGSAEVDAPRATVEWTFGEGEAPPEWCVVALKACLRGILREQGSVGRFPVRLARWRPQPEAEGSSR